MTKITAIWTRDIDGVESVGRVNVARRVRGALQEVGKVHSLRLLNVLETDNFFTAVCCAGWAFAAGLFTGGHCRCNASCSPPPPGNPTC